MKYLNITTHILLAIVCSFLIGLIYIIQMLIMRILGLKIMSNRLLNVIAYLCIGIILIFFLIIKI